MSGHDPYCPTPGVAASLKRLKNKFLDYIITHFFNQDKSLIHSLRKMWKFVHPCFILTSKYKDFVHEKRRRVVLTQIPFVTFRTCFEIYDELNS